jgi:hypothetical protein
MAKPYGLLIWFAEYPAMPLPAIVEMVAPTTEEASRKARKIARIAPSLT